MNNRIEKIQQVIEPLRAEIINHKVYGLIKNLESLRIFMEYHVYAVWDFMSLLKSLQNNLTCTTIPWFPKGLADTRYFINEIVLGEECDIDLYGKRKSHFEMYLDAMKQCGANTQSIELFIATLNETSNLNTAFSAANTPLEAKEFVAFTFKTIKSTGTHAQAAVFTFGREELIPNMFHSIINDLNKNYPENLSLFKYYLERHIEVDGGHHGHLSLQMTNSLCGTNDNYWCEAETAAIQSLKKRICLWDGAYNKIKELC
jgi:hypothetical protein